MLQYFCTFIAENTNIFYKFLKDRLLCIKYNTSSGSRRFSHC